MYVFVYVHMHTRSRRARAELQPAQLGVAAFAGSADRVNLGLIPSSEAGWPVAVQALRPSGGRLHVHANVGPTRDDEQLWAAAAQAELLRLAREAGREWGCRLEQVVRVKMYAPRVRHIVADFAFSPPRQQRVS